jgi:L-amino acid N-acyltransferase
MIIRKAEETDLPGILAIYNDAVLNTTATFDTEPKTVDGRLPWFREHGEGHPILVAVPDATDAGAAEAWPPEILGWASLSRWSDRPAYDGTVELSVYVAASVRGQGLGGKLTGAIVEEGRRLGLHTVISRVVAGNIASTSLHRRFGFSLLGVMKEVGFKFGRYLDVEIYQLMY